MEYTSGSSSLSMSGGDDFTGITEVLDRAVLLDSVQTIRSAKTFADGFTQQFDEGLEIATGKSITGDGLLNLNGITGTTLEVNSVDKVVVDGTTTTLTNPTITMNDGTTDRFSQTTTTTGLTNGTINLVSGTGLNTTKYTQSSTASTIKNTTMNITSLSGGTNITDNSTGDILIQSVYGDCSMIAGELAYIQGGLKSTMYSGLEGEVNVLIDTQEKFNANKLRTNISNTTINLQDETPTTRFAQTNGATTIRNTAINLTDNTPTTRFSQTNGQTTLTNTNIGLTGITTATGNFIHTGDFTSTFTNGTFTAKGGTILLQDGTPTTRYRQTNGQTTLTNTNIGLTGITTATGAFIHTSDFTSQSPYGTFTAKSDNLRLQDTTGTSASETKYYHTTTTTNIANTTINLRDATPTTRFSQTNGTTTITNTNTGVVGNFTASRIFVGTIATNTPLLSFQLAGVKNGTSTSGGLLLQPAYDNVGGQDIFNFQVPFPIRILKYVLMFDADSGGNTNLTLSFYYKQGGNTGTRTFDYTETITTIVSTARTNSQSGNINGTAGLDYTTADIISIDYASAPANEFTLILYAQQRG